jgi:tRNA nucleotidyltransferase (CCA-adding enzyme)
MRAPGWLVDAVVPLVVEHQKPYDLYKINASDRVVRRLARRVGRIDRLARVSKADANGRPPLARQDPDPATVWLLERAKELEVVDKKPTPLVRGRDLIDIGIQPGPIFKNILSQCEEAQLDGEITSHEEGVKFAREVWVTSG